MAVKGCIIFDLDGTLLDDIDVTMDLFKREIPAYFGKQLSEEVLSQFESDALVMIAGKTTKRMIFKMLWQYGDEMGLSFRQKIQMFKFLAYRFKEILANVKFFPGVIESLQRIRNAEFLIALNTNSSTKEIYTKLAPYPEVIALFGDLIIGRDMVQAHKPAPNSIHLILSKTGLNASQCLMVGDMDVDIICGQKADVRTAIVLCGFLSEEIIKRRQIKSDFIFKDVVDLYNHLPQIEKLLQNHH
jgi:HAD superfamily hydrolase (TIGR01549 family)